MSNDVEAEEPNASVSNDMEAEEPNRRAVSHGNGARCMSCFVLAFLYLPARLLMTPKPSADAVNDARAETPDDGLSRRNAAHDGPDRQQRRRPPSGGVKAMHRPSPAQRWIWRPRAMTRTQQRGNRMRIKPQPRTTTRAQRMGRNPREGRAHHWVRTPTTKVREVRRGGRECHNNQPGPTPTANHAGDATHTRGTPMPGYDRAEG